MANSAKAEDAKPTGLKEAPKAAGLPRRNMSCLANSS